MAGGITFMATLNIFLQYTQTTRIRFTTKIIKFATTTFVKETLKQQQQQLYNIHFGKSACSKRRTTCFGF